MSTSAWCPTGTTPRPDGDPARALSLGLRAPAFAVSTLALGLAAHAAGGGALPDLGMVLLLLVAVHVSFCAVARRELSLPRVMAGVGLIQWGLHQLLAAGHAGPLVATAPHLVSHPAGRGAQLGAEYAGPASHSGIGMFAAHGVAAAVLAWWLRRGEAAIWRATGRLLMALLRLPEPGPVDHPALPQLPRTEPRPARGPVLALLADPRRGPPLPA